MTLPARLVPSLLILLLAACPAPSTSSDSSADEQAIRALADARNGDLASQDDSAIAATYAEEVVLLPPGMPRVTGRENARAFFAAIWPLKASLSMVPGTVRVSGDLAAEEGTYIWTMPGPHGPIEDHGNYLVVWRRTATSWETVQDIWNSTLPLTTTRAK